jgi:hypothetical protein
MEGQVTVFTLSRNGGQCTFPFALGVALIYGKSFPQRTKYITIDPSSYSEERMKEEVQALVEKMSDWRLDKIQRFFVSRHKILSRRWRKGERIQIALFFRDVFWGLRKLRELPENLDYSV